MKILNFIMALSPLIFVLVGILACRQPAKRVAPLALVWTLLLGFTYFNVTGATFAANVTAFDALIWKGIKEGFKIVLMVFGAFVILNLLRKTGAIEDVKATVAQISDDRRVQVVIIGMMFPIFLEGAAGAGAPAALAAPFLVALGFDPATSIAIALLGDATPCSWGGAGLTTINGGAALVDAGVSTVALNSAMVGRIHMFGVLIIPFIMIAMAFGRKGFRGIVPYLLFAGVSTGAVMFVLSNFVGAEVTSMGTGFLSILLSVAYVRLVGIRTPEEYRHHAGAQQRKYSAVNALSPYIFMMVILPAVRYGVPALFENGFAVMCTFGYIFWVDIVILICGVLGAVTLGVGPKQYMEVCGVVCSKRLLNQAVGKSLRTHNLKPKKGAQVMRKNEKITALYERLSRDDFGKDDDQQRESNSISNQKAMLEEFAARQGFTNIVHFTDDGISGTCFDRPGFLAMMKEVEAGNVEYLCIKDMSRMGRDYLKVGQIMEILRQRGVRLIAINDGVDSARGDDDFTPFRNIMNEYYARDTSRKIRSTFQSKGKTGKHLTGLVIYGYLWNEKRDQWLVDPEAAEVVKRIFAMTVEGMGPYQIANKLKEEKILIPSAYLAQHGEGVNKNKTFKDVYGWGSSTICNILEKREYLGHTINFKTRKHFKDKKSHYVPEDEWTIFENTHEPIIDQETFDLVQKIRSKVKRYPDGWGEVAPLTGLLYCADCGGKMYVHRTNNGKRISQYTCSQYSKVPVGKLCTTQHRINEDVVLSLVSELLKAIAEYAKHDRAEFVRVVQEAQSSQQTAEVKKQRTRLAAAKQRVSELEVLLCKIYEDNILGKLSDSRYHSLDAQYAKEQAELTAEISALEKAVSSYEKQEKNADRFIALIDKYENFDTLTIAMLNEFIEKILVHERDRKGSIQTTQEVEIYFNFVGRFVPPAFGEVELTPEQLEEIRKREERKDRLHQNYLKRKASGAQKRYEDKIREKKKAEIDAKKAAIRAEDIAKGVFIPVSSLPQREPQKGAQTA